MLRQAEAEEAKGLSFFRIFLWGCMWSWPSGKCTFELTVLGVCGFMSQVEPSNPRARFRNHGHGGGTAVKIFAIPLSREHSNTVQGRRPLRPQGLRA